MATEAQRREMRREKGCEEMKRESRSSFRFPLSFLSPLCFRGDSFIQSSEIARIDTRRGS
jgi:hypothetical protein